MRMKESKGDIQGAAAASQEIQVEVCNALNSYEKADFLLEQVSIHLFILFIDSFMSGCWRLGSCSPHNSEGECEDFKGRRL